MVRLVRAGKMDHENSGVAGQADVGEDMNLGRCGETDFSRGGLGDRMIETLE